LIFFFFQIRSLTNFAKLAFRVTGTTGMSHHAWPPLFICFRLYFIQWDVIDSYQYILMIRLSQLWPMWALSCWLCTIVINSQHFLNILVYPGTKWCFRILYFLFFFPSSETIHFSKEPWILLVRRVFGN
jgi:hypothetical protein